MVACQTITIVFLEEMEVLAHRRLAVRREPIHLVMVQQELLDWVARVVQVQLLAAVAVLAGMAVAAAIMEHK